MLRKILKSAALLACVLALLPGTAGAADRLDGELRARAGQPGTSRVIVHFDREGDAEPTVQRLRARGVKRLAKSRVVEVDNAQLNELAKFG